MRNFLLALLLGLAALAASLSAQPPEPRVVLISIDGLLPSIYTSSSPAAPHLRALAADGIRADGVVGVLPSVTYPSHTTIITGVRPSAHGIIDNRIVDPENLSNGGWFWYARDIKAPTLPMAVRGGGMRAASVSWPVTIGMDLEYLVPEFWRSAHPEALSMWRALSEPRYLLDGAAAARGAAFQWPPADRDRGDLAKFVLHAYDPHLLLVHFLELDAAQHDHGPGSAPAAEAVTRIDGYVGEILEQIRRSGRPTDVAVVSDHGFLPLQTVVQPNAAFKREGLLTVDGSGAVTSWQAYFHSSGGSGFVYVKDAAQRERVHKILLDLKGNPAAGIREVWTRADLDARGAHPDAAFGLDVVDGFYTGAGHDVLVKASVTKGGHGFAPERPALHASMVIAGPSVRRRGSVGLVRLTQIAPTLAGILGVRLSPEADEAIQLR